jgi:hypothetical protein
VILAVPLAKAEELLHDPSLRWTGTRTALLDVSLRRRRGDPFVVSDLDASGWVETFSRADGTLAPAGEQLVQAQAGLRPGETLDQGVERLEALLDLAYPCWRERETWRRRMAVDGESGALDLPGSGWRDRPRGDRGDGVHLVGDMVAAPGVLSEVIHRSPPVKENDGVGGGVTHRFCVSFSLNFVPRNCERGQTASAPQARADAKSSRSTWGP